MSGRLADWVWAATAPHPDGAIALGRWKALDLNPAAFAAADANHDGKLSQAEWQAWMAVAKQPEGMAVWRAQLTEGFSIEDSDHDGFLNPTDLTGRGVPSPKIHGILLFNHRWLSNTRAEFNAADHPADGVLGAREYEDLLVRVLKRRLHVH